MRLDKALALTEPLAMSCGVQSVTAMRHNQFLVYQIALPESYWEFYSRDMIEDSAIGLSENKSPVLFSFDPPHHLIAGSTGSGKSETLKSVIMSLIKSYGEEDLGLVLIDPNRELDCFINESHLVYPIAVTEEDINLTLRATNQELNRRMEHNLRNERRWVIAIDEASADQIMIDESNLRILSVISKQARRYKINLIIGTQNPTHSEFPGILGNVLNRWVGTLDSAMSSARITGHAQLNAHKLLGKGDFLHIAGEVERLQVATITQAEINSLKRSQPAQIELTDDTIIELPEDNSSAGRPKIELDPNILAHYWHLGPDNITQGQAESMFGFKRTGHVLHRDFCREFGMAYLKVRRNK